MKFEHKKKFSVHLDMSSLNSNTFLNYPLSTKRRLEHKDQNIKLDSSPMSLSPNTSYLSSDRKFKQFQPKDSKTNSLKSILQASKNLSPYGKENKYSFLTNRTQTNRLPLDVDQFQKQYNLTKNEVKDLIGLKKVYYYKQAKNTTDQQNGDYSYNIKDHIKYQYEIMKLLGQGSFGQVFQVYDHKNNEVYALKIIKSSEKLKKQAAVEANLLQYIKDHDIDQISNIVKLIDSFIFRGHQCIVFEKLEQNLYELIQKSKFRGIEEELIRKIVIQLLNSLNFLQKYKIVHCDIKPENVMLQDNQKSGIKLVDFGSGCFVEQQIYTYIQSRYYRAPEIIFGQKYSTEIDIWSLGCLIAELYTGTPLFPGEDEIDQIFLIIEIIGTPSCEFAQKCPRRKYFFDEDGHPKKNIRQFRKPNSLSLYDKLKTENTDLVDFLLRCFNWEPQQRLTPLDGLKHPWILAGLPQDIQKQHKRYIELEKLLQTQKLLIQKPKATIKQTNSNNTETNQIKKQLSIKSIMNIPQDTKGILSCRYNDKPLQSERQRKNIALSVHKLLHGKQNTKKNN